MKRIHSLLLAILIAALSGCSRPQAIAQKFALPDSNAPQAWIDAPLPGVNLPLAPYEFVAHGSDETGILQLEWILNGELLGTANADNPSQKLATFRYLWQPSAPGVYTLRARAKNGANAWSEYDEAVFTIGEPTGTVTPTLSATATFTPSLVPSLTGTPTPTSTLTPTPIPTDTPTLVPEQLSFSAGVSTNAFYYGGCQPDRVDVSMQLSNASSVKHVEMFVRLKDLESDGYTDWYSYAVMSNSGNGQFSAAIYGSNITGAKQFDMMTVLYQFVVVGVDGSVLAHSQTYTDLTLSVCGRVQPPVIKPPVRPIIITPTKTFIIIK